MKMKTKEGRPVTAILIGAVLSIFFCYHGRITIVPSAAPPVNDDDTCSTTTNTNKKNKNNASSVIKSLSESMGLDGETVPECCCSFDEVEEVNRRTVYPLLKKIVDTPYFAHFKIDLCSTCELWHDLPLCTMKDCSVCECKAPPTWAYVDVEEIPLTGPDPNAAATYVDDDDDCSSVADDNVVTTVESYVVDGWMQQQQEEEEEHQQTEHTTAQVVDLRLNPEGYTGYHGTSAEKVWSAIHSTNCFQPKPTPATETTSANKDVDENDEDPNCNLSSEQRLYNRFISGLHSSISLHIAHSYCLQMSETKVGECEMWGLNDAVAYERVLKHPERVKNLYVAFSLLLRAVVKAGLAVTTAVPERLDDITDHHDQHHELLTTYWKNSLVPELESLRHKCPNTFNESTLLSDVIGNYNDDNNNDDSVVKSEQRKAELQRRFQHLTSIMQCVGCDRCKLWGTLQTLGIGTALRVLFHDDDDDDDNNHPIDLSRQEAVALVNTLERLSSSLLFAYEFRKRREDKEEGSLFSV